MMAIPSCCSNSLVDTIRYRCRCYITFVQQELCFCSGRCSETHLLSIKHRNTINHQHVLRLWFVVADSRGHNNSLTK